VDKTKKGQRGAKKLKRVFGSFDTLKISLKRNGGGTIGPIFRTLKWGKKGTGFDQFRGLSKKSTKARGQR